MKRWLPAFLIGLAVGVGGYAIAQHGHGDKGPIVKVVSSVDIEEEFGGKKSKATTFELTFEPGVGSAPHRHPGPVFGYVAEGEFEFAINNEKPKKLKAGESFYEPTMALHSTAKNPSDKNKAKVIAVLIHARDAKDLVIPEPAKKDK